MPIFYEKALPHTPPAGGHKSTNNMMAQNMDKVGMHRGAKDRHSTGAQCPEISMV